MFADIYKTDFRESGSLFILSGSGAVYKVIKQGLSAFGLIGIVFRMELDAEYARIILQINCFNDPLR